ESETGVAVTHRGDVRAQLGQQYRADSGAAETGPPGDRGAMTGEPSASADNCGGADEKDDDGHARTELRGTTIRTGDRYSRHVLPGLPGLRHAASRADRRPEPSCSGRRSWSHRLSRLSHVSAVAKPSR